MSTVEEADNGLEAAECAANRDGTGMNIRTAKELFEAYGDDFVSELERVAHMFRTARIRHPLPNGNFLHALCLTRVMLQHTMSAFSMVTGGAGGAFIDCLKSDFREMLLRLRQAGKVARILVLGDIGTDDECLSSLAAEFQDCLTVAYATSKEPVNHYIIANDDMVRDERIHPPLDNDSDADSVVADVYFRNANIASLFAERFGRQWHAATTAA